MTAQCMNHFLWEMWKVLIEPTQPGELRVRFLTHVFFFNLEWLFCTCPVGQNS